MAAKEAETVKPDPQTKTVTGLAYLVLVGLIFWVGSTLSSIKDRVAALEKSWEYLPKEIENAVLKAEFPWLRDKPAWLKWREEVNDRLTKLENK